METQEQVRIVVVGGGFGGLEAALYARRRLEDRAEVVLVSDGAQFLFRPFLTYVPFGLAPEQVQMDLAGIARANGIVFRQGRVDAAHPTEKAISVDGGALRYDFLVLATGAAPGPEALPGLHAHAYTVWRQADMERLQGAFAALVRAVEGGQRRRVVLLVPPGCQWAGPLYELAFMLAAWLHEQQARHGVELLLLTPERAHVEVLGPAIHAMLAEELERRHIESRTGQRVDRVEDGVLIDPDGGRVPFDLLIAAPTYTAAASWRPLPVDAQGFVRTETASRQVTGHPDVYAVGDASDFPVKQAVLALLQADAAAEHLAARVLGTAPAFSFDPSDVWLIEQLDQAVLARVPLGEGGGPAEVERMPEGQLRRMLVAAHLPRQYGENPLYAGLFWKGTQVGRRVLAHLAK